jgi:hypothetical protein
LFIAVMRVFAVAALIIPLSLPATPFALKRRRF